jgi:hypothetical protein
MQAPVLLRFDGSGPFRLLRVARLANFPMQTIWTTGASSQIAEFRAVKIWRDLLPFVIPLAYFLLGLLGDYLNRTVIQP